MKPSDRITYEIPQSVTIAELFGHWDALSAALVEARDDEVMVNALTWAQCRIADDLSELTPRNEREMAMQLIGMSSMGEIGLGTQTEIPEFWDYAWRVATGRDIQEKGQSDA